jgi:hypothetical protein
VLSGVGSKVGLNKIDLSLSFDQLQQTLGTVQYDDAGAEARSAHRLYRTFVDPTRFL